jgi:hypothetical protein
MVNYVNEERFLKWYRERAKDPAPDTEVLSRLYADYCDTKKSVYRLEPEDTVSGKAAEFRFKVDNIGCCGASTIYVYF